MIEQEIHKTILKDNHNVLYESIKHGIDINQTDPDNNETLLIKTIRYNAVNCARTLLYFGINLFAVDNMGRTALHHAAQNNQIEIATMILEHSGYKNAHNLINVKDTAFNTAADLARESRNWKMNELIMSFKNNAEQNLPLSRQEPKKFDYDSFISEWQQQLKQDPAAKIQESSSLITAPNAHSDAKIASFNTNLSLQHAKTTSSIKSKIWPDARFNQQNGTLIIRKEPIGNLRSTEIFNFFTRERTLLYLDTTQNLQSQETIKFENLKDPSLLQEAFEIFRRLGGNTDDIALDKKIDTRKKIPLFRPAR